MSLDPKAGMVIRYDFLWKEHHEKGREQGEKDRPCAIVFVSKEQENGAKGVILCAISHTPPEAGQTAIEIPPQVARQLGLDHERSFIKTNEVNTLTWEKGRLPHGFVRATKNKQVFGMLPHALGAKMFAQVNANKAARQLQSVKRDVPKSLEQKLTERAKALQVDPSKVRKNSKSNDNEID